MIDPEAALLMADSRFALGREYSTPLAGARSGRLELTHGAALLTITGDSRPDRLFEARFGSAIADVHAEDSTVRIVYLKHGMRRNGKNEGRLALNPSIPWNIEFLGGVAKVEADLRGITLHSLSIKGGVSQFDLTLPAPADVVPISITGGMHQVTIKHPADAAVRLRLTGGASQIAFGPQRFGAVGGELVLVSPTFETAAARYDVLAVGGASGFKVLPG